MCPPQRSVAVAGWALPLWILALRGLPAGATATRAIAALAGIPPYAAVAIAVTLLLAALQTLAGALARPRLRPSRNDPDQLTRWQSSHALIAPKLASR